MRKLLFVLYTIQRGGAEKVLIDLVNSLPPDKYRVTVHVVMDGPQAREMLAEHVEYRALLKYQSGWKRKLLIGFWQYLVPCGLAYRWFFRGDYDVEIAYMEGYPTKLLAHSANCGARRYAWEHIDVSSYTKQDNVFLTHGRQVRCYQRYDRIFCVSEAVKRSFIAKFGMAEKVEVIHNLLDDDKVRRLANEPCPLPRRSGVFRMVSVGRLAPAKRYDRLIAVTERLAHEKRAVEVLIVGDGAERERLASLIAEKGLEQVVTLAGYQSNPYPYMASADMYVCASDAEGLSTVVCEALIVGTPVVTTRCGGMEEILGDGSEYGLLTECSEDGLYQGIVQMMDDAALLQQYREQALLRAKTLGRARQLAAYERLFDS